MSQNGADPGTFNAFPDSLNKEAAANATQLANGHPGVDEKVSSSRQADSSSSQETGASDRKPIEGRAGNRGENYAGRTSIVGDVLQSIAAGDDEGRSRQRILAFAAKRYANAVDKNPQDADALYNWALVLQETADSLGNENASSEKDALLDEACKKYEAATRFCPTLHEAFYNWGIAVSDRAKLRGRTKEAEELWKQACQRYERSVQLNWTSPQALNNWGLALQELGAIVPLKEKRAIVKTAIRKFRAAIRLRFDFHRAVYNLGTVLYGLAEDTIRSGRKPSTSEGNASDLYSSSAVYIAAAHSLKPEYPVYRSALRLVRSMLPLPYMKVGYLTVPPDGNALAPHADWTKRWFVLDHDAFYETEKAEVKPLQKQSSGAPETNNKSTTSSPEKPGSGTTEKTSASPQKPNGGRSDTRTDELRVEVHDMLGVAPTADLSLPPGGGLVIDTPSGQHYLIADSWDAADGWVDAIRLVYTIFARGKTDALASVLTT